MNLLPSIRQAYSFVSQEEKQRHSFRSQDGLTDNINGGRRFEQDKDNFSGGRRFEQDRRRFGPRRGRPHCSHCGEPGH